MFLQCLYEYIPILTPVPSKLEMFPQGIDSKPAILSQNIWRFMIVPKQVKDEASKSWLSLCSSLQPYAKSFHKFVKYYTIDYDYNIDT